APTRFLPRAPEFFVPPACIANDGFLGNFKWLRWGSQNRRAGSKSRRRQHPEHRSSVLYAGCRKGQTPCPIRLLMPIEPTQIAGLLNFRFAAGSVAKWGSASCQKQVIDHVMQRTPRQNPKSSPYLTARHRCYETACLRSNETLNYNFQEKPSCLFPFIRHQSRHFSVL